MEDEKKTSEDVTEEEVSTKEATSEETPKADIKEETEVSTQEEVKEEVKDEAAPASEAPTIIDNSVEPPVAPIQDLPRTAKLKEPMSKQKKITIIVAAVVAFIALFSILFFPIFFCYVQGRIHVYDASDFVPQDGKRFVLEKDIVYDGNLDLAASTCSIDLQGHNLTVNGTLTIGKDGADIQIGTLKKGTYTSKGVIVVDSLVVNAPEGSLNFASTIIASKSLDIKAKEITINTATVTTAATFETQSLVVNGPLTVANDTTTLTLNNCAQATFNDEVGATIVAVNNSNLVLNAKVKAKNIVLDADSTLVDYGEVASVVGGKKVAMLKGHTCSSYIGVNILAIYNAYNDTYEASYCNTIVYLETLPTPVDFFVSEEGGVFKAICAKVDVYDAIKYKFYLDDKAYDVTTNNFVDITSDLKAAGAANHKLQAYALGNFDFATLEDQTLTNGQKLYLDCEVPATIEYAYTLKLTTPKNVAMRDYELNAYVEFDSVEFADYYVATVDKTTRVVLTSLTKDEFIAQHGSVASQYGNNIVQYSSLFGHIAAPLTSQLQSLGFHSIRLVACSFANEIETSKEAMTSYKTTKQIQLTLENVTATSTQNNDGTYTNTITVSNCEDGKVFVITIGDEVIRLSNTTTYSFTSEKSKVGNTFKIKAEAYGYYTESAEQEVTFTA